MIENKIKLRKVGIFSPQFEHPVNEFLEEWFVPHGVEITTLKNISTKKDDLDLVLSFGGDGTVLAALSLFPECPVLAVNFGNVGFLSAGEREELTEMLQKVVDGDYIISERSVLKCIHPYGIDFA